MHTGPWEVLPGAYRPLLSFLWMTRQPWSLVCFILLIPTLFFHVSLWPLSTFNPQTVACMHAWVLSPFSHVRLFATLQTVAHQAPLSMGFSRQEYWSGLLYPPLGDLPNPGIEPRASGIFRITGGFFSTEPVGKPQTVHTSVESRTAGGLGADPVNRPHPTPASCSVLSENQGFLRPTPNSCLHLLAFLQDEKIHSVFDLPKQK